MSKIILFGNQKGGVGKSTVTCLCANALSQAPFEYKLCIIDNDQQKSISEARQYDLEQTNATPPYGIHPMSLGDMQTQLPTLDQQNDLVFIDTAGKLDATQAIENQEIAKAIMYADYLFLPFRAGSFNLDATLTYLQLLINIQDQRAQSPRPLHIFGFINMYRARSKVNHMLISEVKHLKQNGLPFMVNRLGNYTLFEDVNTLTSLYDEDTSHTAKLNFTVWLHEFLKLITQ